MLASLSTPYGRGMRAVIVVPTYDEAGTITALLDALVSQTVDAPDARMDVLVVDDSSPDGTSEIVRCHSAFGERIRLLTRTTKDALGGACRAGFAAAIDAGHDVVVQMDADGAHPTGQVPAMLAGLRCYDVVIGSRYIPGGSTRGWSARRRALSWAANRYARGILRLRTRDATSGFRAWRVEALVRSGALETKSNGYGFQVENTWRAERAGLGVVEHPIIFTERTAGASKMSIGVALEAAGRVLQWRILELLGRRRAVRNGSDTPVDGRTSVGPR